MLYDIAPAADWRPDAGYTLLVRGPRRDRAERWLKRDPLIAFPATKDEVLSSLRRQGAPETLLAVVRAQDLTVYESSAQVDDPLSTRIHPRSRRTKRRRRPPSPDRSP